MSFEAKITCDFSGCCNELSLNAQHPSDSEIELEDHDGNWLFDHDQNTHYCPTHALEAANELGLEYSRD